MATRATPGLSAILVVATGCLPPATGPQPHCAAPSDCGADQVCSRANTCAAPAEVRVVTTTWTIDGAPPTGTTCRGIRELAIDLLSPNFDEDVQSYAPLPCLAGSFALDRLPLGYDQIHLGLVFDDGGTITQAATIRPEGANGVAAVSFASRQ